MNWGETGSLGERLCLDPRVKPEDDEGEVGARVPELTAGFYQKIQKRSHLTLYKIKVLALVG
jgi:hypothetical protein